MRVLIVGADLEENLGIGMIGASAVSAGHEVQIVPFNDSSQLEDIAAQIARRAPEVVGLSMQFQHRSHEFLSLARSLREAGYRGHITCGGQFPTLAHEELLAGNPAVDTVVLHEGEQTFVGLLAALSDRTTHLADVAGLALRDELGAPMRTADRPLESDLDSLPRALRYRPHARHMGVPFIPIMGSRGCWGACAFCSISAFYRDARARGGGRLLRHRSPDDIADEMAQLWRAAGDQAVFCFHDDNFLFPRPEASMQRIRAIREALDRRGVGRVALIGKCRPDSLTRGLARELHEAGVVRLYVGVENTSEPGAAHLNRGVQTERVREALAACSEADIFCCYNLLIFEPAATFEDIEQNIAFIRDHASHPVNFGRVEAYYGTPLHRTLAAAGNLSGSYLGHGYRIADDRVELLFRICAAAFRERNYDCDGVHNRFMGLGYGARLLEYFYEDHTGRRKRLADAADALTRSLVLETADFLDEALLLARQVNLDDRSRIERETALLGLRIAAADRARHAQLDHLYAEMEAFAAEAGAARARPRAVKLRRAVQRIAQGVAVGAMVAGLGAAVEGCEDRSIAIDPDVGPLDGSIHGDADAPPLDYPMVVDPDVGPLDVRIDIHGDADAPPLDYPIVVDPDVGPLDLSPDGADDHMVGDPLPPDAASDSAPPSDGSPSAALQPAAPGRSAAALVAHWRDTAPQRVTRTTDLPLFDPPTASLAAHPDQRGIRVCLSCGAGAIRTRWEGDGAIDGDGREVLWTPESDSDRLRVAVRSVGGVTIVSLRASSPVGGRSSS